MKRLFAILILLFAAAFTARAQTAPAAPAPAAAQTLRAPQTITVRIEIVIIREDAHKQPAAKKKRRFAMVLSIARQVLDVSDKVIRVIYTLTRF